MANPLYEAISAGRRQNAAPQMNMQDAMSQLMANPAAAIRQAGYNVPDDIAGNPQSVVAYLIQTGQVSNPLLQRIVPMINQIMGR